MFANTADNAVIARVGPVRRSLAPQSTEAGCSPISNVEEMKVLKPCEEWSSSWRAGTRTNKEARSCRNARASAIALKKSMFRSWRRPRESARVRSRGRQVFGYGRPDRGRIAILQDSSAGSSTVNMSAKPSTMPSATSSGASIVAWSGRS